MLTLRAIWNNITYLTQALSNDLENIEKWSTENKMYINTEKTKALLVTGKGFNISLVRKQQPYNYSLTPQIWNKFVSQVTGFNH